MNEGMRMLILEAIVGSKRRELLIPIPKETVAHLREMVVREESEPESPVRITTDGDRRIRFKLTITGFRINL